MRQTLKFFLTAFIPLFFYLAQSANGQRPKDQADKQTPKELWQPYYITPRTDDQHIALSRNWMLAYRDDSIKSTDQLKQINEWINVAEPTTVHWALYKVGKLPHPYKHLNSKKYEWVENKIWYYKKEINIPETARDHYVFLNFDGLDYYSRIWVNGQLLGRHEGMFGGPSVEISELVNYDSTNEIIVEVFSANLLPEQRKIYEENVRGDGATAIKGWAFTGGTGVEPWFTVGMWQGARIEIVPKTHIERPYLVTQNIENNKAEISLSLELFANHHSLEYQMHPWDNAILSRGVTTLELKPVKKDLYLRVEFYDDDEIKLEKKIPLQAFEGRVWIEDTITIPDPKLWWPVNMGNPFLYKVSLKLMENDQILDNIEFNYGIRTIERKRSAGLKVEERMEDWHFIVNDQPMFIKGVNWMPVDVLLDLPKERYQWLLQMAKATGIQMIRVWASGLIETDTFYDLCDSLGIMVWQDFPISHVDAHNWPQEVWEAQVVQNIFRLRNHASLALWNGGNGMNPYSKGNAATMGILERNLNIFDPNRFFSRTSSDAGNAHVYPDMDPSWYAKLYQYVPYISETGMHSVADPDKMKRIINAKEFNDLENIYSKTFAENHPEIIQHFAEYEPSRVPRMLSRASHINNMAKPSLENLSEATQVGAGEFYQILSEGVQSNYPNTAGLMPWVFNRIWPVFSAIMLVDGHSQPVAPFYFLKRTYEPIHVSLQLPRLLWKPGEMVDLEAVVNKPYQKAIENASIKVKIYNDQFDIIWNKESPILVNGENPVARQNMGNFTIPADYDKQFFFVTVELSGKDNQVISKSVYWPRTVQFSSDEEYENYIKAPQAWPYLKSGPWLKPSVAENKTKLTIKVLSTEETAQGYTRCRIKIVNKGKNPSFMTELNIEGAENLFYADDNFFWLEGGEEREMDIIINWKEENNSKASVLVNAWNAKPDSESIF